MASFAAPPRTARSSSWPEPSSFPPSKRGRRDWPGPSPLRAGPPNWSSCAATPKPWSATLPPTSLDSPPTAGDGHGSGPTPARGCPSPAPTDPTQSFNRNGELVFQQLAAPVGGSLLLSALCAALPLLVLFVLLGIFRVKAHQAALAGLLTSVALALFVWRMPVGQTLSATTEGFVYGLVPILWILVNALWIYKMTVATSWFDVLGRTIRSISNDLRILAIIVAFCFGALLESLAGFGAPVAITAAMLMAAGMKPLKSAAVSLLANTAPVAFGSMGTPIIALHGVTGIPLQDLSSMAGRQTPLIALLVPLLLVFIVDGWRGVRQTWPIAIVAGVTFGVAQFLTSNFVAVELTDVVASVATACAVLVMLRFWQPAEIIGIHDGADSADADGAHPTPTEARDLEDSSAGSGATGPATAVAVVDEEATKRPATSHVWMAVAPYLVIIAVF